MPREKNAKIRAKKAPVTTLQILCQEKKKQKFEPKMDLTLPNKSYANKKMLQKFELKKHVVLAYKSYAKKKNAQIRPKKAPNTTLQKL